MATVFHGTACDQLIRIKSTQKRKTFHRMNHGSNFIRGSFTSRDSMRIPIQFRRKWKSQCLKWWAVLWAIKWNKLIFPDWNQHVPTYPCPWCLMGLLSVSYVRFKFKRQVLETWSLLKIRNLITFRVGSSINFIISIHGILTLLLTAGFMKFRGCWLILHGPHDTCFLLLTW